MRAAATVIFFAALGVLGGCPSTNADDGCYLDRDCASGYVCDASSGACVVAPDGAADACQAPSDCGASYTCSDHGRCLPGDCYFNGCVTGFECQSSTGTWECLPSSTGAAGAAGNEDTAEAGTAGVRSAAD